MSTDGLPAASLLPPAFSGGKPDWIFSNKDVPEDQQRKFFLTSEFHAGWRYFTLEREIRLSKDYPKGFEHEIGYRYGNGPDKFDGDGKPKNERAKPNLIWMARAWFVEEERMVALIIDSSPQQRRIGRIMQNPAFFMLPNSITNFYLTLFNYSKPATQNKKYDAEGAARALRNAKATKEAALPFWPEQYWAGHNPFEPPPDPMAAPPKDNDRPATFRDENGADHEVVFGADGDGYVW